MTFNSRCSSITAYTRKTTPLAGAASSTWRISLGSGPAVSADVTHAAHVWQPVAARDTSSAKLPRVMALLFLLLLAGEAHAGDPWGVYGTGLGPEVGCRMHQLAFEKALSTLPQMLPPSSLRRRQVWDSLLSGDMTQSGMGDCVGIAAPRPTGNDRPAPPSVAPPAGAAVTVYVDATAGSDTAPGSMAEPVQTAGRALTLSRHRPKASTATITVRGVGFRDAGYTYMSPHGNPGGGDWGLQSPQYDESGAVYLSGTEDVLFDSCTFKYLDGNAVFISGYNRTELRSTLRRETGRPIPVKTLRLTH